MNLRFLGFLSALVFWVVVGAPWTMRAQSTGRAVLSGTVTDSTGAVVRNAIVHLADAGARRGDEAQDTETDGGGEFQFTVPASTYLLRVEAPGFAAFSSRPLRLEANARVRVPVRLMVASQHEEISVLENGTADGDSGDLVLDGDALKLLSGDPETLRQQLMALAGGPGALFQVDGFGGGRLPPKSAIRAIRINKNSYSAYFATLRNGTVEIDTKPGTDRLHGELDLSGTDQPLDARNPYLQLSLPFYDFQQYANLNGPIGKKTSFFVLDQIENLANNAVVNAANPDAPSVTISEGVPAPQRTQTYSARVDHQFSDRNFGFIRDEWTRAHIVNSGINPLVLPSAAFTSDTMTNTLQLKDTQMIGAHASNEARFQYLRTRVRQDPNSTLPSVVVQSAFQGGGSPTQVLRDNQDAYEFQDLFELDRGKHTVRAGLRVFSLRDANASSAGFNGQYIFPDVASYLAPQPAPSQFSVTQGQASAVLVNNETDAYAEDDWRLTPNFTLSYGLRFESQSAIPDHSDPAPRIGFNWAVRPGKRKTPIVTVRGGYGIFYDRFPAPQLLQAIRQNGVNEVAYVAQGTSFSPYGSPQGVVLSATEPTVYRVNPALRSSYAQSASVSVLRSFGRFGTASGNLLYQHNTHNFLTRNINAPLPGTFNPLDPASGVRPLGTAQNIYQFSSDANGNLERFYLNYQLHVGSRLFGFGTWSLEKNNNESDGVERFASNQYNLRQDYGPAATEQRSSYSGGLQWTAPFGLQLTPFLVARTGLPFDITTGTDLNGDTIYNDRPGFASDASRASVVTTAFGSFDTVPVNGPAPLPRNYGRAPGFLWLQLRAGRDFHVGPRPASAAAPGPDGKPGRMPDRPWVWSWNVEVQNLTNHNNPGLPVGVLGAEPCGSSSAAPCTCAPTAQGTCPLAPSQYFGHSLSLASFFSPNTASNRTILLQTSFSF